MSLNHKRPPSSLIFIFGGSGDLNHRKLAPALYNLYIDRWMPEKFDIVGIGRRPYDEKSYRDHLLNGIKLFSRRKDDDVGLWQTFSEHVAYLQMDAEQESEFQKITEIVKQKEQGYGEHPN